MLFAQKTLLLLRSALLSYRSGFARYTVGAVGYVFNRVVALLTEYTARWSLTTPGL